MANPKGDQVYQGMIIGENSRSEDIDCNPCKTKELTNVRSVMKDDKVRLQPPKKMSLEECIAYISDEEFIEVTPKSIRLRKIITDPALRRKNKRNSSE